MNTDMDQMEHGCIDKMDSNVIEDYIGMSRKYLLSDNQSVEHISFVCI